MPITRCWTTRTQPTLTQSARDRPHGRAAPRSQALTDVQPLARRATSGEEVDEDADAEGDRGQQGEDELDGDTDADRLE